MANTIKAHLGDVLASRALHATGRPNARIVVRIGTPRRSGDAEWVCPYHVSGVRPAAGRAFGVDAFQALILALQGIRNALDRSGRVLTWDGGEIGATGFPRLVPDIFGVRLTKRLERVIDREIDRWARAGMRAARRRKTRAS